MKKYNFKNNLLRHLRERKSFDLNKINSNAAFNSKSVLTKVDYRVCRKCLKIWHSTKFRPSKIGWMDIENIRRISTCRKCESKYQKHDKEKYPAKRLYKLAKQRARNRNIPFNITIDYIRSIWPKDDRCPVTKKKFKNGKNNKSCWATLDRVINDKGYIIGNVAVISYEVNAFKSNAIDLSIFEKMGCFYNNFVKNAVLDDTDSTNPENVMSRYDLFIKNPNKYKVIHEKNKW